jgi:hypothetical protein
MVLMIKIKAKSTSNKRKGGYGWTGESKKMKS